MLQKLPRGQEVELLPFSDSPPIFHKTEKLDQQNMNAGQRDKNASA